MSLTPHGSSSLRWSWPLIRGHPRSGTPKILTAALAWLAGAPPEGTDNLTPMLANIVAKQVRAAEDQDESAGDHLDARAQPGELPRRQQGEHEHAQPGQQRQHQPGDGHRTRARRHHSTRLPVPSTKVRFVSGSMAASIGCTASTSKTRPNSDTAADVSR